MALLAPGDITVVSQTADTTTIAVAQHQQAVDWSLTVDGEIRVDHEPIPDPFEYVIGGLAIGEHVADATQYRDTGAVVVTDTLAFAQGILPSGEIYSPLDPPVEEGAHYFTLDELRAEQDIPADQYPDAVVEPNRTLAEEVIEQACGCAFIPRRRWQNGRKTGAGWIRLNAPLVRVVEQIVVDGVAWTDEQLAGVQLEGGYLLGAGVGAWSLPQRVAITYTHGYETPPARIRRAAMIATRVWTIKGPVDDRATQIAADGATVNLATPGLLGSITGIPEVDATIAMFARPGRLY